MAVTPSPARRHALLIQVERRGRTRRIGVSATAALVVGLVLLLTGLWAIAATVYLAFRDDVVGGLMQRQQQMRYAYEDRIAALRAQMDRVTSRQLVDQDSFEGKVQELAARQAQLETRQALVNGLMTQAAGSVAAVLAKPAGAAVAPASPAFAAAASAAKRDAAPATLPVPSHPAGLSAFAPEAAPTLPFLRGSAPAAAQPQPAPSSPAAQAAPPRRPGAPMPLDTSLLVPAPGADKRAALAGETIGRLDRSLQGVAAWQEATLGAVEAAARSQALRLKGVVAELGLDPSRFKTRATAAANTGGPLVPLPVDGEDGPFADAMARAQRTLVEAARLKEIVAGLPLARPLAGDPEVTSTFGTRVDPFTRGLALHTGVDLKDDYGTAVKVTAPGVVTAAEWTGGYGNMVEVDHGNGLSTRYGHLSVIGVTEGQAVQAGAVIGRVGSTGRSTGPHLHYETRIDGDPVDPMRFLRVSRKLAAN
jgi:murein DD-endopeptidase MepM/ murein hydrolase activator NlpD